MITLRDASTRPPVITCTNLYDYQYVLFPKRHFLPLPNMMCSVVFNSLGNEDIGQYFNRRSRERRRVVHGAHRASQARSLGTAPIGPALCANDTHPPRQPAYFQAFRRRPGEQRRATQRRRATVLSVNKFKQLSATAFTLMKRPRVGRPRLWTAAPSLPNRVERCP